MDTIKNIYEGLKKRIRRHSRLYYILNIPEIPDHEYDDLFTKLKTIEKTNPNITTADSPTRQVGGRPLKRFASIQHTHPMLSIDKAYTADDLRQFDQSVRRYLNDAFRYTVERKMDGVAASLRYEDGNLTSAATRGDGATGNDITSNIRAVSSIPRSLKPTTTDLPHVLEVRGEVFMTYPKFAQLNTERRKTGKKPYANPRNATAGTLKMLDSQMVAQHDLQFFGYAIGEAPHNFADSQAGLLNKLHDLAIPTNPVHEVANDIEEVITICRKWQDRRCELDYPIDGMVIKVDGMDQQSRLGHDGYAPHWCIAYKFAAEQKETIVESIDVKVSKTGTLTPIARLQPIRLAETKVSRVNLYNYAILEERDIRAGDTVLVEKKGDVIPQIVKVLNHCRPLNSRPAQAPRSCPKCGSTLATKEHRVAIRCINPNCPAKTVKINKTRKIA